MQNGSFGLHGHGSSWRSTNFLQGMIVGVHLKFKQAADYLLGSCNMAFSDITDLKKICGPLGTHLKHFHRRKGPLSLDSAIWASSLNKWRPLFVESTDMTASIIRWSINNPRYLNHYTEQGLLIKNSFLSKTVKEKSMSPTLTIIFESSEQNCTLKKGKPLL